MASLLALHFEETGSHSLAAALMTIGAILDIHACAENKNGQLRLVDGPDDCNPSEYYLTWNAVGTPGDTGPQGPQGDPGPAGSCADGGYVYFDCTTAKLDGGVGVATLTDQCITEFGPGARICTSEEYMTSSPIGGGGLAWIRPVFIATYGGITVEASGIKGDSWENLSCGGWTTASSSNYGLIVTAAGEFLISSCDSENRVACCVPSQ